MQRALILFGFVLLSGACSRAAPAPVVVATRPAPRLSPPPRVMPTGCRAEPATVYGDEAVVFDIQAPSSTLVDVELIESSGRSLARASLQAPGKWRPPPLPSGDFVLEVTLAQLSCQVTVNRELPRATQTKH